MFTDLRLAGLGSCPAHGKSSPSGATRRASRPCLTVAAQAADCKRTCARARRSATSQRTSTRLSRAVSDCSKAELARARGKAPSWNFQEAAQRLTIITAKAQLTGGEAAVEAWAAGLHARQVRGQAGRQPPIKPRNSIRAPRQDESDVRFNNARIILLEPPFLSRRC